MNTIKNLALNWFNDLDIKEYHRLSPHNNLSDEEIENIFYNEVILKWAANNPASVFDSTEERIKERYLKEHSKEEPTENYRRIALDWWETLPFDSSNTIISKRHYFEEYKSKVFTPALNYTQLTGREVQNIWAVKTETKEAEMIPEQPLSVNKDVEMDEETEEQENERILNEAFLQFNIHCKQPSSCRNSLSQKCICPQPKVEDNSWDEVWNVFINSDINNGSSSSFLMFLKQNNYTLIKKQ